MHLTEKWFDGAFTFVNNNYSELKNRYNQRIQNFKDYCSDGNNVITFILTSWNKSVEDLSELKNAITNQFPSLKYNIHILNTKLGKEYYIKHLKDMNYTEDDYELKRLL